MENWLITALSDNTFNEDFRENTVLKKLTVVILSYCRQDFILRQVAYWNGSSAKILIMDGSPLPLSKDLIDIINNISNISYHHLNRSISERLRKATELIDTSYAVMLGDDEFHLEKGLGKAIEKLESNLELSACMGQSIGFDLFRDKRNVIFLEAYNHWRISIEEESIEERIKSLFSNYSALTCYSVQRSDAWKKSWGGFPLDIQWSSGGYELFQNLSTVISGKLTTIDDVYWMRSSENPPVDYKKDNDFTVPIADWWNLEKYKIEKESFKKLLVSQMHSAGVTATDALKIIDVAIDAYLNFNKSTNNVNFKSRFNFKYILGYILRIIFSERIYFKIRFYIFRRRPRNAIGAIDELSKAELLGKFKLDEKLLKNLKKIEKFIISFHSCQSVINQKEQKKRT